MNSNFPTQFLPPKFMLSPSGLYHKASNKCPAKNSILCQPHSCRCPGVSDTRASAAVKSTSTSVINFTISKLRQEYWFGVLLVFLLEIFCPQFRAQPTCESLCSCSWGKSPQTYSTEPHLDPGPLSYICLWRHEHVLRVYCTQCMCMQEAV